jgi:hypothetical protein
VPKGSLDFPTGQSLKIVITKTCPRHVQVDHSLVGIKPSTYFEVLCIIYRSGPGRCPESLTAHSPLFYQPETVDRDPTLKRNIQHLSSLLLQARLYLQSILRPKTPASRLLPSCRPRPRRRSVRPVKPRARPIARVESRPQVAKAVLASALIRLHRNKSGREYRQPPFCGRTRTRASRLNTFRTKVTHTLGRHTNHSNHWLRQTCNCEDYLSIRSSGPGL